MNICISSCNNIDSGSIDLIEGRLNIKYAINGTGKSTIANAIEYTSNSPEKLKELIPYKYLGETPKLNEHQPSVVCSCNIRSVAVFNQKYIDQYIFLPNELLENSFEIFVKTPDYEERMQNIQILIQDIQRTFSDNPDIDHLIEDLFTLISGYGKAKGYSKNGSIAKGLGQGNKVANIPAELIEYTPYIRSDMNAAWLVWQSKGTPFLHIAEQCPYCASGLHVEQKAIVQQVATEYDSKYIEELQKMIGVFKALENYFTEPVRERINVFLNRGIQFSEEEIHFLTEIKTQVEILHKKLNEIKYLDFGALKDVDTVIAALRWRKIDLDSLVYINSQYTMEKITIVNCALESVIAQAGKLQGEISKQKIAIQETIGKYNHEINGFLESAGYPYKVSIVEDTQKSNYRMILKNRETSMQIDNVKLHLSFGERNAFALVLFMYKTLKENPDLVVLDDPVSSFDKNKKYAIMEMLFRGAGSLQGRTVMMLTHDFDPIIDMIYTLNHKFYPKPVASFLWNKEYVLSEKTVESTNVMSFYEIANKNIHGNTDEINKLIYLRRFFEAIGDKGLAWQLISNVFHPDRETPMIKTTDEKRPMTEDEIVEATRIIKTKIPEFEYNRIYRRAHNKAQMIALYNSVDSSYERVQLYRIINYGNISDTVFKKFVDEVYHIENDDLFQLNPAEYCIIPEYIIQYCDNGIKLLEEGE